MYKVVTIALLLVVAVGCSTENPLCTDNCDETTDAGMEEQILRDEWTKRIEEQDHIPVLGSVVLDVVVINNGNVILIENAGRAPKPCILMNNYPIDNKTYTCHGSVWIREATKGAEAETYIKLIDSTIKINEICAINPNLIIGNINSVGYKHRILMDMTIDGKRMLYVTAATLSLGGLRLDTILSQHDYKPIR